VAKALVELGDYLVELADQPILKDGHCAADAELSVN
jgi:hypothetical protein